MESERRQNTLRAANMAGKGRKRSREKTGDGCVLLAHPEAMSERLTPVTYFY